MTVDFERQGPVALITLNRPEARNAINGAVAAGIEAAIDTLESDPSLAVGVLRAVTLEPNPVFSAGADLKALDAGTVQGMKTERGDFGGIVYRKRDKPIIVAIDGLATAGGCEIVLACDIIVASTRSSFGLAEVKRNLAAGAGGLFRLARALGRSTAMEAALTALPVSAQRAFQLGLVSRFVEPDEVLPTALEIAQLIAANGPLAVQASRRIILAAEYADDDMLKQLCWATTERLMQTEDTAEGVRAFVEKRAPVWKGR